LSRENEERGQQYDRLHAPILAESSAELCATPLSLHKLVFFAALP
jgi:hypothetical protein